VTAAAARLAVRGWIASPPAWWCVAAGALAWAAMLSHALGHGGHVMGPGAELGHWMLMVAAMMLPLMIDGLRTAAARSLWRRRHRAIALFTAGYFAPWLIAGLPVVALCRLPWARGPLAAALAFGLAALWLWAPARRRALAGCHRTVPLAPCGGRADRDCLRYGALLGQACVVSCWPMMLACTLTGHALVAMVGAALLAALERRSFRRPTRTVLAGTLGLAGFYLLMSAL
jgi:hypothetical protein